MPVLGSSAYNTAEDVLNMMRAIVNDSEIAGGDVLTDSAPFTFVLLNGGFRRVQIELAAVGVETMATYFWLIGLPTMPTVDPEARLIINDSGSQIIYPNGVGNVFANAPILPSNLVCPLKLWERQNGTVDFSAPMKQAIDGLAELSQQTALVDWEWINDSLQFRGALQSQDVKIRGEQALTPLAAPTDPVPIRGVVNAAAYYAVRIFEGGRGSTILPEFKEQAEEEIFLLKQVSVRRRQRRPARRQPYSGRHGGRGSFV